MQNIFNPIESFLGDNDNDIAAPINAEMVIEQSENMKEDQELEDTVIFFGMVDDVEEKRAQYKHEQLDFNQSLFEFAAELQLLL